MLSACSFSGATLQARAGSVGLPPCLNTHHEYRGPILLASGFHSFDTRLSSGVCQVRQRPLKISTSRHQLRIRASASSSLDISTDLETLKRAARTRKVPAEEVFAALQAVEKAKVDPSTFLDTLGGSKSPGHTWMLVFTSGTKEVQKALKGGLGSGSYFPITAVQRFDQQAMEIENGVFLGPVGNLTFKGPMGWQGRRLSFTFNTLSIKLGPLDPFKFEIGKKEDAGRVLGVGKEGSKDPFFTWFYADEEIVAARGRGGGIAFWCRCKRVKESWAS